MKPINYREIYQVYSKEISKADSALKSLDQICDFFINKIKNGPELKYIGNFDHYAHTKNINGEIAANIVGAVNVLFCFGKKLPEPMILAVRPRSIGVCETDTHWVISFMEAPNPELTNIMIKWTEELAG